jgi:UDP-2,3-diacylglucosamine pyrophosphatase LpxH
MRFTRPQTESATSSSVGINYLVVRHARWLALLGDGAYTTALFVNTYLNIMRRKLGLTYWSPSSWAKLKVENAVNHIAS